MMMSSMNTKKTTAIVSLVAFWHGAGVIGVDGSPVIRAFDPTKCRIDRSDDQFKSNEIGGQCARCVTNDQCRHAYGGFGWYCCPFMKRCVNSVNMGCYDTALCRPRCFGEKYPELKKDCSGCDSSFPDNWVKGCTRDDWPSLVAGGAIDDLGAWENQGGNHGNGGGAPAPEWCEWCLEDVLPSERAETCGFCEYPGRVNGDNNNEQRPAARESSESEEEVQRPGVVGGNGNQEPQQQRGDGASAKGACGRIGNDGAACQANVNCEWDWGVMTCVAVDGSCESIGADGRACNAAPACEWSWTESFCLDAPGAGAGQPAALGKCERIGADGEACSRTDGCRWDWDAFSCMDDPSARVASAVNPAGKGGKKGKKQRGGSGCAGLNSKKCSRNSACILDGRVCRDKF